MKKSFRSMVIVSVILVTLIFIMSGCAKYTPPSMIDSSENNSRFVLIERIGDDKNFDSIYVDTKTGVEYFVHHEWTGSQGSTGSYSQWGSVLMGADGLPILADGYSR